MNLGDFSTTETIYVPFASYDANGASVTLTGLATTDIEIFKDGSATTRSSDSGYALLDTDGIDFALITGIHGFSVDLSDDTDAGFYAAGSQYFLVVSAVTIASQAVSFVYYFTIGRTAATVNAQVLDVLNVDTFAEPGKGTPAATTTLVNKIGYLYKNWRNRKTETATTWSLYNDDAVTVDHQATVADTAGTGSKTEIVDGP